MSKRSWADIEEDESFDIFSIESIHEFMTRYHNEHIQMGFIPADTPLVLPSSKDKEVKPALQKPNPWKQVVKEEKRVWRK